MYIALRYYFVTFLMLMIVSDGAAQINIVFKTIKRYKSTGSESRLVRMGLDKREAEFLSEIGYDDTTITNLRNIGVDLPGRRYSTRWDEKVQAALSDCIVVGSVDSIEHPQGKTPYHTIAYVDAEYFLRNDYNVSKYRIPIMIESGPNYTRVPDDTLGLGNHVLLFLSSSSLINFAHHFLQDYYNQLINDSTVRFRISGGGKYLLKPGEQCPVEWEDEIKQVVKMRPRVPVTNE